MTKAGALDVAGREALLRYGLRPPLAQERLERRPVGLVRITLKQAYNDGMIAVNMDALSLLCRLAMSVPPPRKKDTAAETSGAIEEAAKPTSTPKRASTYRPWAELLKRTFGVDLLACPKCGGRMKLVAMLTKPKSITPYLVALGEKTGVPARLPSRGPPLLEELRASPEGHRLRRVEAAATSRQRHDTHQQGAFANEPARRAEIRAHPEIQRLRWVGSSDARRLTSLRSRPSRPMTRALVLTEGSLRGRARFFYYAPAP